LFEKLGYKSLSIEIPLKKGDIALSLSSQLTTIGQLMNVQPLLPPFSRGAGGDQIRKLNLFKQSLTNLSICKKEEIWRTKGINQ
jgi:hypothetical protein